jgi:hypothetical protein
MKDCVQYEIFVICPDCGYRRHYFTDQKLFDSRCPGCGRRFGGGDLPTTGRNYGTKSEIERVDWLRRNFETADRQNLGPDVGVVVIRHSIP